jgi:uncharacterized protein (TIGR00255 family)
MVKSMTAYARLEEKLAFGAIIIEMRSVNHRFLELAIKIPEELRALEMNLRERVKKKLKRGKIDPSIHLHYQQEENQSLSINSELAKQIAKTLHDIDKLIYNASSVSAIDILNWPGVLERQTVNQEDIKEPLLLLFDKTLDELLEGKKREGNALEQMITQRIDEMRSLIDFLSEQMPELLLFQQKRLEEKLQSIKADLDNERLEQEMVFMAQKADVAEELERLTTHLDEIRRILDGDGAIGRRLDFLMQELNREANTLGSKSIANVMTQTSVNMKVLIEQMREQIQNIE